MFMIGIHQDEGCFSVCYSALNHKSTDERLILDLTDLCQKSHIIGSQVKS